MCVEVGAAPAIDALILVADGGQVAVRPGELGDQGELRLVGVLELVDQQVAGALAQAVGDFLVLGEQLHREAHHVVEVDARGLRDQRLVAAVDARHALLEEVLRLALVLRRREQAVLGARDRREDRARREARLRHPLGGHRLDHQALLVVGVENREVARQPDALAVTAQQRQGVAVKGADEGRQRKDVDQPLDAVAHLARRLVGEGDGDDRGRVDAALLHQPGDAIGDDPGLARAGAGEDELRPIPVGDGGELIRIELFGEIDGGGSRHSPPLYQPAAPSPVRTARRRERESSSRAPSPAASNRTKVRVCRPRK